MIQEVKDGYVKTETHQGVTTIEFYHPQGNSLPGKILEALGKEIHFAGTHSETKVIILKSAGDGSFCAGASFDELITIKTEAEGQKFFSGYAEIINAARKCPKFIIGRIQGKCVGGGVGLAAAVDYAIATEKAEIKLSELELGFGPFVVGPVIERKIGVAAFNALAIDAAMWRNSEWAKRKGLFAEVHESIASIHPHTQYRQDEGYGHPRASSRGTTRRAMRWEAARVSPSEQAEATNASCELWFDGCFD